MVQVMNRDPYVSNYHTLGTDVFQVDELVGYSVVGGGWCVCVWLITCLRLTFNKSINSDRFK